MTDLPKIVDHRDRWDDGEQREAHEQKLKRLRLKELRKRRRRATVKAARGRSKRRNRAA